MAHRPLPAPSTRMPPAAPLPTSTHRCFSSSGPRKTHCLPWPGARSAWHTTLTSLPGVASPPLAPPFVQVVLGSICMGESGTHPVPSSPSGARGEGVPAPASFSGDRSGEVGGTEKAERQTAGMFQPALPSPPAELAVSKEAGPPVKPLSTQCQVARLGGREQQPPLPVPLAASASRSSIPRRVIGQRLGQDQHREDRATGADPSVDNWTANLSGGGVPWWGGASKPAGNHWIGQGSSV